MIVLSGIDGFFPTHEFPAILAAKIDFWTVKWLIYERASAKAFSENFRKPGGSTSAKPKNMNILRGLSVAKR